MFDTHKTEFNSPAKVVHEYNRAPTDESIRFAQEYEDKILQKITDKFQSFDNTVNISFFRCQEFISTCYVMKLTINGRDFSEKFQCGLILDEMIDKIVNWVAYNIVRPSFYDVMVAMNSHKNFN